MKKLVIFCLVFVILLASASAVKETSSFVTRQDYQPSFQSYYSSSELRDVWPVLSDIGYFKWLLCQDRKS